MEGQESEETEGAVVRAGIEKLGILRLLVDTYAQQAATGESIVCLGWQEVRVASHQRRMEDPQEVQCTFPIEYTS
eukprot:2385096-Amphidinium_carterae.1